MKSSQTIKYHLNTISKTKTVNKDGAIYSIKCDNCDSSYIGESSNIKNVCKIFFTANGLLPHIRSDNSSYKIKTKPWPYSYIRTSNIVKNKIY